VSGDAERWLVATTEYAGLTPYTGGIGRHYAALLPALAAAGATVDLVLDAEGPVRDGADLHGVRLVSAREGGGPPTVRDLDARARHVCEVYRASGYDRVFVPEWGALGARLPGDAPLLTNLATGARLVREVSGMRPRDVPRDRRRLLTAQIAREERQIRRSRGVVAISAAMLARVRSIIPDLPKAAVVPNCIDVAGVRHAARASPLPTRWPVDGAPLVLFPSRIEARKGVVEAVAAFARVFASHPRARLVLAGAGGDARFEPTRDLLVGMLPTPARERVTFLGHVEGPSLYAGMRAADVVVCPSRWEGFGQVALEAKAAGSPLVATRGSGFDDFCTDGVDAILVRPGDPDDLAAGILRCLDDPPAAAARTARAAAGVESFAPAPIAARVRAAADALLGPVR
jgi:glycogen synthase